MEIPKAVVDFFRRQNFVIVSTLDAQGQIYCSAKGLVAINQGRVYVADLYHGQTFKNLTADPRVSLTAIDEQNFIGYTLQGQANLKPKHEIPQAMIEAWENKIVERMSQRVVKGVQGKAKSPAHFEAGLPPQPQYVMEVDVTNIINLSPPAMHKNHHG